MRGEVTRIIVKKVTGEEVEIAIHDLTEFGIVHCVDRDRAETAREPYAWTLDRQAGKTKAPGTPAAAMATAAGAKFRNIEEISSTHLRTGNRVEFKLDFGGKKFPLPDGTPTDQVTLIFKELGKDQYGQTLYIFQVKDGIFEVHLVSGVEHWTLETKGKYYIVKEFCVLPP